MGASLVEGFVNSARNFPRRLALDVNGFAFTYADLGARASSLARTITERDNEANPYAALLAYRSSAAYVGILGILLAHKGYVPLNPRFPAARTLKMLDLCRASTLVVGDECEDGLYSLLKDAPRSLHVIFLGDLNAAQYESKFPQHDFVNVSSPGAGLVAPPVDSEDPAYLLFTSGSTGTPKGVSVSHRNVRAYLNYVTSRYDFGETDRFSQMFDLTFDLSVHDMFVCWERGGCLCVVPESSLMAPARFIKEKNLTAWFSVPSAAMMMSRLRMLKPDNFPSLRVSLFCGEALPAAVADAWQSAAPNSILENLYGPTEATIAITHYRWHPDASKNECVNGIVPIGRIFKEHEAYLSPVEGDGEELNGEVGELCLAGPQVTLGYLNNAEKTREQFIPAPSKPDEICYRTGDLVRRDKDGCMHFLGRLDNQVKIRGHRVELQEVEQVLREMAGTNSVVAVAWPGQEGRADGIVAFLVESEVRDLATLRAFCAERLPDYMIPHRFHFLDEFPLNANGKVDKKKLHAYLEESIHESKY